MQTIGQRTKEDNRTMRKVSHSIPIEIVLPERYEIQLSLCGEQSELSVHEYYSIDTPLELVDNTIKMFQDIVNQKHMKATITRVSDRQISMQITGTEFEVINSLDGEVALLRKWTFSSLPSQPAPPQFSPHQF